MICDCGSRDAVCCQVKTAVTADFVRLLTNRYILRMRFPVMPQCICFICYEAVPAGTCIQRISAAGTGWRYRAEYIIMSVLRCLGTGCVTAFLITGVIRLIIIRLLRHFSFRRIRYWVNRVLLFWNMAFSTGHRYILDSSAFMCLGWLFIRCRAGWVLNYRRMFRCVPIP